MLKSVSSLRQAERDVVTGYYRLNYHRYLSMEIMQLSMLYTWLLEEFDCTVQSKNIKIKGKNKTICCALKKHDYGSVFGRNSISSTPINELNNYYHWRLKILSCLSPKSDNNEPDDTEWNFIIGLMKESETGNCGNLSFATVTGIKQTAYAFIGNTAATMRGRNHSINTYSNETFKNKNDIIDMYYDGNKGALSFVINNHDAGVAFSNIDTSITYRMALSLYGKKTSVRLLSYHNSAFYPFSKIRTCSNMIGFGRCVYNIDDKMKYYKQGMEMANNGILNEWHNDYIDCLCILRSYEQCAQYIIHHKLKRINVLHNMIHIVPALLSNNHHFQVITILRGIEQQMRSKHEWQFWFYTKMANSCFFADEHRESVKYFDLCLQHIDKIYSIGEIKENEYVMATDAACLGLFMICYELKEYVKALSYVPRMKEDRINQILTQIAVCYKFTKDYDNAIKHYEKLIAADPTHYEYLWTVADIYKEMGNDEKAEKYTQKLLNNDPDTFMEYAQYLRDQNKIKEAIDAYEKAAEYQSDNALKSECFVQLGMLYGQTGDLNKAVEAYQNAMELDPTNSRVLNNMGYDYMELNEYELAHKYLKMCLDMEPDRYLASSNMANCLCKLERYEEAVPFLQKAISRDDDLRHPDAGPLCLYNYANILNMKQEYKESVVLGGQLIEKLENDDSNRINNVSKYAVYILMAI